MSDEPTSNPRGPQPPTYDASLDEAGYNSRGSLVESLGDVADDMRQIAVDLGARPYTVHAVCIRWSGGEQGRGDPVVVSDVALKPTPELRGISAWERSLESGGVTERGDSTLIGVSPRYTEDELTGYLLPASVEAHERFLEVRIDERDGTTTRRRFVLHKAPERRPTDLDWRLTLRKQEGDRGRDGSPRAQRERVWPGQG